MTTETMRKLALEAQRYLTAYRIAATDAAVRDAAYQLAKATYPLTLVGHTERKS